MDPNANTELCPKQDKESRTIAAQACETCRSRKQRCDEHRPKCGLCKRLGLECRYRETQPTKKDKTLVEILNRLKSIELKVDQISTRELEPPECVPHPSFAAHSNVPSEAHDLSSYSALYRRSTTQPSPVGTRINQPYRHTSAAHQMLTWPAVQQFLSQALPSDLADLRGLEQEGSAFIVRIQEGTPDLPRDEALPERRFVGMQSQATRASGVPRVTFPALKWDTMHNLATAYFDTFNLIYPFMDRQSFISDTLAKVHTEGFDDDAESITALLIFALGQLAIEGSCGDPIETYKGRASGVRGGTSSRPPGLAFFNEARKHIGFLLTQCDLENIQIFSLAALYYESCSRHVEFWRLTVFASLACKVLVTCHPIDWSSPRGDLIKRAYWHCAIMETGLHLELDLPRTGLIDLEDQVGIPSFNSLFCEADYRGNQVSHYEAHYASQLALRRLCVYVHDKIDHFKTAIDRPASPNEDFTGPSASSLKQLAAQITQWRGMLPQELQWDEDEPNNFPSPQPLEPDRLLDQNRALPHAADSHQTLFTADIDSAPVHYPYVYDIQVALLRTRYYYAMHMVYRPFVYKALHFPEHMTFEDAQGAAECLRYCLKWPLVLSPTSHRKRLIPYLFCWSQNILGVLLILHLTVYNPILRDIRAQLCGPRFEAEVDQTVELMIDWIRDLRSVDTIAMWCWKILQIVYHDDL